MNTYIISTRTIYIYTLVPRTCLTPKISQEPLIHTFVSREHNKQDINISKTIETHTTIPPRGHLKQALGTRELDVQNFFIPRTPKSHSYVSRTAGSHALVPRTISSALDIRELLGPAKPAQEQSKHLLNPREQIYRHILFENIEHIPWILEDKYIYQFVPENKATKQTILENNGHIPWKVEDNKTYHLDPENTILIHKVLENLTNMHFQLENQKIRRGRPENIKCIPLNLEDTNNTLSTSEDIECIRREPEDKDDNQILSENNSHATTLPRGHLNHGKPGPRIRKSIPLPTPENKNFRSVTIREHLNHHYNLEDNGVITSSFSREHNDQDKKFTRTIITPFIPRSPWLFSSREQLNLQMIHEINCLTTLLPREHTLYSKGIPRTFNTASNSRGHSKHTIVTRELIAQPLFLEDIDSIQFISENTIIDTQRTREHNLLTPINLENFSCTIGFSRTKWTIPPEPEDKSALHIVPDPSLTEVILCEA